MMNWADCWNRIGHTAWEALLGVVLAILTWLASGSLEISGSVGVIVPIVASFVKTMISNTVNTTDSTTVEAEQDTADIIAANAKGFDDTREAQGSAQPDANPTGDVDITGSAESVE